MLDFDGMIADIKSNTGSCFMTLELHLNFMPGLNSWIMRQVQEQATLVIVVHCPCGTKLVHSFGQ